jgi:hypothetical protein
VGVCYLSAKVNQIDPEKNKENGLSLSPRVNASEIFTFNPLEGSQYLGYETADVSVLQPPLHGTLSNDLSPRSAVPYYPDPGYVGNDKVIFLVNIGGYKVKVVFFIKVLGGNTDPSLLYNKYCPNINPWKISQDANGNSVLTAADYLPSISNNASVTGATLTSILGTSLASSLDANTSGVTLNIADLAGGAVGQTTGTSITLDTNAAGYGWYVDPNPAANTDFLPTSNPDVWMAKAGVDTLKNAIKSTFKVYILVSMLQHLEF